MHATATALSFDSFRIAIVAFLHKNLHETRSSSQSDNVIEYPIMKAS